MKLAACYTIWNGLELLNGSIDQIINDVDIVIIGWQHKSNKGEVSKEIESFIEQYVGKPKIYLVEFVPNFNHNTKLNELNKHNLLLDTARQLGCSHFFLSATDHYYKPEEFRKMKIACKDRGLSTTFTRLYTYYKHPTWQMTPIEVPVMPFICKLSNVSKFLFGVSYPYHVDPSLKITPVRNSIVFEQSEIMMHHYSMIRNDIANKFNNAASSVRWDSDRVNGFLREYENAKPGDKIKYFGGRTLIEVENYFNIGY